MAAIAVVCHEERELARQLAIDTAGWLLDRGHEVRLPDDDARRCDLAGLGVAPDELAPGLDLAVSFGGDGTILRAVDLVADDDVPVLGVNVGQLGYLTEVEPSGTNGALKRFLAGAHQIEQRLRLQVEVRGPDGGVRRATALNEAVIERSEMSHTVKLAVTIDGDFFTAYVTDALLVATPTGSTAYVFSARGPIVAPTHEALVVTPVSPHTLFDRSLVLGPRSEVEVAVVGHRAAWISVDGQPLGEHGEGTVVVCRASPHPARLVTFGPRHFHRILKRKFGLNDR